MIRNRQMAVVGVLLMLVLSSVLLVGVRGAAAQESAAEEPAGSWLLTEGIIQQKRSVWAPEASARILFNMKVDIKDGVLTADYTGPFSYSFGPTGSMSGTVTVSMRGAYAPKTGMSGTFNYKHEGTHVFGFADKVEPTHVTRECTFTGPAPLRHGDPYMINLSCNKEKPFSIAFNVAMADVGQGPVREANVDISRARFGADGSPNQIFYDWPDEPPDESPPTVESFSGDIAVNDPDERLSDTFLGWMKGSWRMFTGALNDIRDEHDPYQMESWNTPKIGAVIKDKTVVRARSGGAKLVFKDGTTIVLKAGFDFVFSRGQIIVERDGEYWAYKKFGRSIQLVTKRSRCSMFGTSYSIKTNDAEDVLEVFEGRVGIVLVKDPEKKVVVVAGEKVTVTDDAISPKESIDVEKEVQAWKEFEKAVESGKAPGAAGGCSLAPALR